VVATPLARITVPLDVARGPDVTHRVDVAKEWLTAGAKLSVELPRNLTCATCSGGGCDACRRAGAITLRRRSEPPEVIDVILATPGGCVPEPHARPMTVRIPERGGPAKSADLPRGVLMLTLMPALRSHPSVRRSEALVAASRGFASVAAGLRARTGWWLGIFAAWLALLGWLLLRP
jgi:hypothetical protein